MPVDSSFAQGIDISKWNGVYKPYVKPVDFVIIKATDGLAQDPRFFANMEICKNIPVVGAYHYYRSQVGWREQARNFLATAHGAHFLAVDYEHINNVLDRRTDGELKNMLEYLRSQTNKPVIIYAQHAMLNGEMLARGANWVREWEWWVARWWERGYYERTPNIVPGGAWKIWQYGGDYYDTKGKWSVPGYKQGKEYGVDNDSIDLNAFNGTLADMMAWCGISVPTAPEAPRPSTQPVSGKWLNRIVRARPL